MLKINNAPPIDESTIIVNRQGLHFWQVGSISVMQQIFFRVFIFEMSSKVIKYSTKSQRFQISKNT